MTAEEGGEGWGVRHRGGNLNGCCAVCPKVSVKQFSQCETFPAASLSSDMLLIDFF